MRASAGRVRVIRRTPAANNGSGPAPSKRGRKTKLNSEVQKMIVETVRKGAYDWVAAEAAGITRQTFYNWMRAGEASTRSRYSSFFVEVTKARAEARAKAEQAVYETAPLAWLRFGPGRERPGQAGVDGDETGLWP